MMLVYWFHVIMIVIGNVSCEQNIYSEENNNLDSRVDSFKKKWDVEHVLRDLEHIKEDMKEMMNLKTTGKLTQSEILFYLVKMHDFDNNGGLDGIEIRTTLAHSMNQNLTEAFKKDKTEELIENFLLADYNNDGVVDFGELRRLVDDKNKQKEET